MLAPLVHLQHYSALLQLLLEKTPLSEHGQRMDLRQAAALLGSLASGIDMAQVHEVRARACGHLLAIFPSCALLILVFCFVFACLTTFMLAFSYMHACLLHACLLCCIHAYFATFVLVFMCSFSLCVPFRTFGLLLKLCRVRLAS
jgi:hypothetical protein